MCVKLSKEQFIRMWKKDKRKSKKLTHGEKIKEGKKKKEYLRNKENNKNTQ